MAQNSRIEWTDHTLNLWHGCVNISPACDHCYAETQSMHWLPSNWLVLGEGRDEPRRTERGDPERPNIWGPDAARIFPPTTSNMMTEPFRWNRNAEKQGCRERVFVMSMGDLFEKHRLDEVNAMMDQRRRWFFEKVVPQCTGLDFLALTKRPHAIRSMVPPAWLASWPGNVWVGATVEDQQRAVQRLPHVVALPAPVRFISAEPLLGPLDLAPWIKELDWVIGGGESGTRARETQITWVRSLRDQCVEAGVPFFFKQWGLNAQRDGQGEQLVRMKTKNFRLLDGREWNEMPQRRPRAGTRMPTPRDAARLAAPEHRQ